MNPRVILVGAGDFAEVLYELLIRDGYLVDSFFVEDSFFEADEFCGQPVYKLSTLTSYIAGFDHDYRSLVAIGYSNFSRNRERVYGYLREAKFTLGNYVSSKATVWKNALIGSNIIILDNSVIEPFVTVRSNTIIWSGATVSHHSAIGENCFIAPCASIAGHVNIRNNCFIGINSIVYDNVDIGEFTILGGGVRVSSSLKENTVLKLHDSV